MRRLSQLSPVLVPLLLQVLDYPPPLQETCDLHSLELFAGKAEISHACSRLGFKSVAYDKSYSDTLINDLVATIGFKRAMELAARVRPHGMVWAAPVCSSWVWISRSGSGRSSADAAGHLHVPRIRHSNKMVVHLVLLMLLAWVRGCHIFVENPVSSVINFFSPFSDFLESCMPHKATVHLGSYGADTQKSVTIWSTSSLVQRLRVPMQRAGATLATRTASGSVTGKGKALKASQAYPRKFGEAVAAVAKELIEMASPDDLLEDFMHEQCIQLLRRLPPKPKQIQPRRKTNKVKRSIAKPSV